MRLSRPSARDSVTGSWDLRASSGALVFTTTRAGERGEERRVSVLRVN